MKPLASSLPRAARWTAAGLGLLLALEAGVRLAGIAPPLPKVYGDDLYVPDPWLPYHQRPSISRDDPSRSGEFREVFTHNSAGFRDVERPQAKPPGAFRILAVGGSLTWGSGAPFDETYLALLERGLNAGGGEPRVEIVKAGIGGFFPEAERLLVEHYGLAYEPDLLLVEFDGTDLYDTWRGAEAHRVTDGFLKTSEARRLGYAGTLLAFHTHVGRILYTAWARRRQERLDGEWRRDAGRVWEKVLEEYGRMRALMAGWGGGMAVHAIPLVLPPEEGEWEPLAEWCRNNDIPFIDTTPELAAAAREGPVYYGRDGHLNPRGYRAVAEALERGLRDEVPAR